MSKDAKNVPALRFKGFSDAWEKRKLGDMAKKVVEKNKSGEFKEVLTNSAENGIISQRDFFDKDIANKKSLNGYYVVRPDDFVYNPRISNSAPVGPIKRNRLNRTGIMSPLYFVFRVHNVNHGFLEQYFSANVWHHFMTQNGDTGARSDRFAIKDSVFVTMPILIPSVAEQQQIASSLQALDGLIAATQGKLDQLEMVKKALLQHLFDQSMRFKGYSDPWEKRKLDDLSRAKIGGGTPSTKASSYWNGDLPWIQSSDIDDSKKYSVTPRKFVSPEGLQNSAAKRIPANSIAVVTRVGVGKLALIGFDYSTSQDFLSFVSLNWSASFSVNLLTLVMNLMSHEGQGTSIKGVTKSELLARKVRVPNLFEEQEKIGSLLRALDNLIAATQSKLSSLESLKKALLQGLFI